MSKEQSAEEYIPDSTADLTNEISMPDVTAENEERAQFSKKDGGADVPRPSNCDQQTDADPIAVNSEHSASSEVIKLHHTTSELLKGVINGLKKPALKTWA